MENQNYAINIHSKLEVTCDELQFYEELSSKSFYQFEKDATIQDIKQVVVADEKALEGNMYISERHLNPHLKTNEWYVEKKEVLLEGYWPNSGNCKYEDVPNSVKLFTLPDEREFVRDAIIIIKIDITAQKHQIEHSSDDSANTPPGSPCHSSDDSANTPPGFPYSSSDVTDGYHASLNNGGQQADVNPDPSQEGNDQYEEGENEEPLDLRIPKRR